jgi:proliferating cell nuclear antigen
MSKVISLKTEFVSQFKTLFEVLKDIMHDTTIEFVGKKDKNKKDKKTDESKTPTFSGMRILNVSPDKTVLVYLRLDAKNFSEFECNAKNGSHQIGVDLQLLNKMLKSTEKEDDLMMYIDDSDRSYLIMTSSNNEMSKHNYFKLKLMDLDPIDLKTPPINYDVDVTMPSGDFSKICKEMAQLNGTQSDSTMEIWCSSRTIEFRCSGQASRVIRYTVSDEKGVKIKFVTQKDKIIQGVYELKHLNQFAKCASLSQCVQLLMKVDKFPLCIKYSVATLGTFVACITPKEASEKPSTYEDNEEYYQEGDEVELKNDDEENAD